MQTWLDIYKFVISFFFCYRYRTRKTWLNKKIAWSQVLLQTKLFRFSVPLFHDTIFGWNDSYKWAKTNFLWFVLCSDRNLGFCTAVQNDQEKCVTFMFSGFFIGFIRRYQCLWNVSILQRKINRLWEITDIHMSVQCVCVQEQWLWHQNHGNLCPSTYHW